MHELGVVIEVIKTVEDFARNNGVTKIDTLVLQIGELSSIIPQYIEECYPAAVDGTLLQETKLKLKYCRAMLSAKSAIKFLISLRIIKMSELRN